MSKSDPEGKFGITFPHRGAVRKRTVRDTYLRRCRSSSIFISPPGNGSAEEIMCLTKSGSLFLAVFARTEVVCALSWLPFRYSRRLSCLLLLLTCSPLFSPLIFTFVLRPPLILFVALSLLAFTPDVFSYVHLQSSSLVSSLSGSSRSLPTPRQPTPQGNQSPMAAQCFCRVETIKWKAPLNDL